MRYAVVGGDMRFAHLVHMLNESGREAKAFLQEGAGEEESFIGEIAKYGAVISNWPVKQPLAKAEVPADEIFEQFAPGTVLLLCGPGFPEKQRPDLQYVNLWEDERLLQENAWLTAEAAAAGAMQRRRRALKDVCCGVIGYGRIGRALTEILLKLGADVRVFTGTAEKRAHIMESGADAVSMEEIGAGISDRELIFSTPPALVLDREALRHVRRDAMVIDLASPPYGVDMEAAKEMNLQAFREPGLPGRYCPLSAGRAIYHAVLRWEEEENHE